MTNFSEALKNLYGEKPAGMADVVPAVAPIKKQKIPRTLGDASLYAEAQRVYNPEQPASPKAPAAGMIDQGSAPALDTSGRWGTQGGK